MTDAAGRAGGAWTVAREQAGMLTRAQLRDIGFDADRVRNQLRAKRWQAWGSKVIAPHTGPLSTEQIAWFAVLDGGNHCTLAGLSALHRYGLSGFDVDRLQTAVPLGTKGRRHDLFVRRQSRRLDEAVCRWQDRRSRRVLRHARRRERSQRCKQRVATGTGRCFGQCRLRGRLPDPCP